MFKIIQKCRFCNSSYLQKILDLGSQPPANDFRIKINNLKKIPLIVVRCKKCKLIQLNATVKPEKLFSKYFWVTGTSNEVKDYRKKFIEKVKKYHSNETNILEIASNDGFFLKGLKKNGFKKILGIDPAKNIAQKATNEGIKTIPFFFNFQTSKQIKQIIQPKLIICRNVIPHVENINSVISGISNLISKSGNIFIEFHYARNLAEKMQYDYIYHEHIFYYSIKSLENILKKYGLKIFDCFKSPISGGSIVLITSKKNNKKTSELLKLQKLEKKIGINEYGYWKNFATNCLKHKFMVKKFIKKEIENKQNLVGYGASARGSTFLNYCNLSNKEIKYIFDKNKLKKNHFTPGSNILIKTLKPKLIGVDNVLILAWNFKKEIIKYLKKLGYKKKITFFFPKIISKKITFF